MARSGTKISRNFGQICVRCSSLSAEKSALGIIGTLTAALLNIPEVRDAKNEVDKAREDYEGTKNEIVFLQKEMDKLRAEIKKTEQEMEKAGCE